MLYTSVQAVGSKQASKQASNHRIFPIGIDVNGRKGNFIELNLANYSDLFGDRTMFETLDQLPEPDLIIASPPCESWSVASSMFNGNASWKKGTCYALGETTFIPRGRREYKMKSASGREVQFKFKRSFLQRINGELTAFNTIRIIARYKPKVFVIENPKLSRIWKYIDEVLGVKIPYRNDTYYSTYGFDIHKPTSFHSNIDLGLIDEKRGVAKKWNDISRDYNIRSNIPLPLIKHIYDVAEERLRDD